jgi:uncharacterized protein YbjT (DUF2867 family)
MEVLVTGASGVLGSQVSAIAVERGHIVRRLSRSRREQAGWTSGDLATGNGIGTAVEGVDVVIHCATDPRHHKSTDVGGTSRLLDIAGTSGRPHIVYPGIVGSDVIPLGYYRSKTAAEQMIEDSDCPSTIQRYTQFHDLIWEMLRALTRPRVVPVPNDTRFQVLDAATAALRLVEAAEGSPAGRLADLGGPTVYDVRDLARSVATALGRTRRIVRVNVPGLVGAAFRAGGNLTENRDETGATWNEYLAAKMG